MRSALQLAGLVGVARHHEGAAAAQANIDPRNLLQLAGKDGPQRRGTQPEVEYAAAGLAELDLGDRREHPRRHMGGTLPRDATLQQRHRQPRLSRAPSGRETNDAAAHDYGDLPMETWMSC